jgi:hypothetical protein
MDAIDINEQQNIRNPTKTAIIDEKYWKETT